MDAVVLEQVAGAEDGVDLLLLGQGEDPGQRVAAVLPPPPGGLRIEPGERGVEMEVREVEQLHRRQGYGPRRDS
jgi:hypothetical protein